MSLSLFAVSHDDALLENLPDLDFVRRVNLNRLDIDERFQGQGLSENRIFLSEMVFDVDTEFVGLVSARYDQRVTSDFPKMVELGSVSKSLKRNSLFAPSSQIIAGPLGIEIWAKKQDAEHPGMASVLETLQKRIDWPGLSDTGVAVLGNQFIVHRDVWLNLVNYWRALFLESFELWGMNPPFSHRCYRCGANKPNGYERYGPHRQAGFLGERITAMFLGQTKLELSSLCHPDPNPSSRFINFLTAKQLGYVWQLSRAPNRINCEICR